MVLAVSGVLGQVVGSASIHPFVLVSSQEEDGGSGNTIVYGEAWITYTIFFAVKNISLNMVYTVMMALIPDLIPPSQTGVANGILAMMVARGSLFGFGMFHTVGRNLMSMYMVCISISLSCGVITYVFVLDREVLVRSERRKNSKRLYETMTTTKEGLISCVRVSMGDILDNDDESCVVVLDNNAKGGGDGCWNVLWSIPCNTACTLYAILYKSISTKSYAEIASAYWIDTHKYRDFYIVTISRFFYYIGD